MPDPFDFEARFEARLVMYAARATRPFDAAAVAASAAAGGRGRSWGLPLLRRSGRRGFETVVPALLLIGLLIALFGALLLTGGRPTPSPVRDPWTFHPIFLRAATEEGAATVDVIAVGPNGQERVIRRLEASSLTPGRSLSTYGSVSPEGWLAVSTHSGRGRGGYAWALIDLADPAREPRIVPYQPVIGGAWGPGGLFATNVASSGWSIMVVDADTGETTTLAALDLPGGGPDLIWAADGSGLVVRQGGGHAIAPIDGRAPVSGVPELAPRLQRRWLAPGGSTVGPCGDGGSSCPPGAEGVRTADARLRRTDWYTGELGGAKAFDSSFAANGQSVWLLLDQSDGVEHTAVIARADEPLRPVRVGSVDLGAGVTHMWIHGLAPDDTIMAINAFYGDIVGSVTLIDTAAGTSSRHSGSLVGFVPATVADAWPGGGEFITAPDITPPVSSASPAS
jgi:hypothetical protein